MKLSPTKHTLFILRFQHLRLRFPERITSNIYASVIGFTFSRGTFHLPAFYFLFCLIILVKTLEFFCCYLSIKYAGIAPSYIGYAFPFAFFYSCSLIVFFICIFCLNLSLLNILALIPRRVCAFLDITLVFLAYFLRRFYYASNLSPNLFCRSSMN